MVRRSFEDELEEAVDFLSRGRQAIDRATGRPVFTQKQVSILAETSFLCGCVAWERFLELSLAHYVLGERAPSGYRPKRIIKMRATLPRMRKVFAGDKNYVGWIESGVVRKRAGVWLKDGGPYGPALTSGGTLLTYLRKLRNVVAHDSESAFGEFEDATRQYYGSVPSNFSAGGQLLAVSAPSFGGTGGELLSDAFAAYRLLAQQIVPV